MPALLTVLACDVLFAVLAVPLILRRVPPNVIYGYRTRATLSDEALWYEANAHFGRGFLASSIVSGVGALALWLARTPAEFVPLGVVVLVVPPLIAALATARYIRKISSS